MSPEKKYLDKNDKMDLKKRSPSFYFWFILITINLLFFIIYSFSITYGTQETNWKEFKENMLLTKEVKRIVVVNKDKVEVYIKPQFLSNDKYKGVAKSFMNMEKKGPHYFFQIGSLEMFEKQLEEAQLNFSEKEKVEINYLNLEKTWWESLLNWVIPFALILFIFFYFINRLGANAQSINNAAFDFGKSRAQIYGKGDQVPITFKDVAGYEEAKTEVMEVVDFLKHPSAFKRLGAKIPKGILLVGAPGTGKTLMAKAVAGEAGVPFFSLSGSEFIEMFVGVGASRVRDLFNRAKQKAPSIVFIDEIDTIGRMRGKVMSIQSNDERESTLNQLLAEMDGFGPNTGVIVLAATNRADILDPALLRPGRFDRHIQLDLPNKQERFAIFKVHSKFLLMNNSVDLEDLAAQTPGFSGADIANICNEAALIAARKKKKQIESQDFTDAIERIISGIEKKSKLISPIEKKIIAYHEAGHAVVSWMLKNVDSLNKVSIIPRGKSLGGAWYLPEERQIVTRAQLYDSLCAALGGRVAEELVFKDVSSGALDDLEKVTKQAYMMVSQLGLNDKIGNISFYDSTGIYESSFQKPYSEATAQLIDEEVRKLVSEAKKTTRNILESNREKLDELAEMLLKKEVLFKEDIESVLGKRTL